MKCMICGGQTLPGAKLCLPCRAALRRARDDTISELLPLPRRREAFAFSHSPDIGHPPPAPAAPAAEVAHRRARNRRLTSAQLHAAAVVAFVAAAGVLTFIMARELQRERVGAAAVATPAAPAVEARPVVARVSPSTMLGPARDESAPPLVSTAESGPIETPPAIPAPVERRIERQLKPRSAKTTVQIDAASAGAAVEPPLIILAPAPAPAPAVRAAPPDRTQVLAAALANCGGDFFARVGCEQRTRAQYCDGQWGQVPQCPAGIANDHGQ